MARKKPEPVHYPTELVLQAACAAQRLNGKYISVGYHPIPMDSDQPVQSNATRIRNFLEFGIPVDITDEDRELAKSVRNYFQTFTLKLLTEERMSDFDRTCMNIANGDTVITSYIGQAAYMPEAFARAQKVQMVKDRIYECRPAYVGNIGDKVTLDIEVVKVIFSKNYGCYFITAVTKDNLSVFFSSSTNNFAAGVSYTIKGKIKAHRDDHQSQLNYVKIS